MLMKLTLEIIETANGVSTTIESSGTQPKLN